MCAVLMLISIDLSLFEFTSISDYVLFEHTLLNLSHGTVEFKDIKNKVG